VSTAGTASGAFSAHAGRYDASRRRLVPDLDAFYAAVVDVLGLLPAAPRRVLDLGAGTGLVSAAVLAAYPATRIVLLDASGPMLTEAQERLGDAVDAVHVTDMRAPLPAGPFAAIVSGLAIHHLEDGDKRTLFARVHDALAPGGVFVNAEQVAAPSLELNDVYTERWIADCRRLGADATEIAAARERMRHDRCADLESQLTWLRGAGLRSVDCLYKRWQFAVVCGFRGRG
jgi:tRNA (cmo5U34)-methyltransferase